MSSSTSSTKPPQTPWSRLVEIAGHLHLLYSPGDDSVEFARSDVRMLLEATRRSLEALEATIEHTTDLDGSSATSHEPMEAVTALLRVFHMVLRGLNSDIKNAAHDAAELLKEIESLHGPA